MQQQDKRRCPRPGYSACYICNSVNITGSHTGLHEVEGPYSQRVFPNLQDFAARHRSRVARSATTVHGELPCHNAGRNGRCSKWLSESDGSRSFVVSIWWQSPGPFDSLVVWGVRRSSENLYFWEWFVVHHSDRKYNWGLRIQPWVALQLFYKWPIL